METHIVMLHMFINSFVIITIFIPVYTGVAQCSPERLTPWLAPLDGGCHNGIVALVAYSKGFP